MTTEQKARAYDEALKVLHKYDGVHIMFTQDLKEEMFPELKESEDERIRKEMIFYFQEEIPLCSIQEHADKMKEFVAWLEKQKPVEFCEEDEKIRKAISIYLDWLDGRKDCAPRGEYSIRDMVVWLEKQSEQILANSAKTCKDGQNPKHFELKAGHWYICHRAFCCRADHLTVKEGERFMCEKDGIVKGFVIKEPEKYFKEVCAPAPMEDERKPDIEMKTPEESLGVDSDTYNKIVDECVYGEQNPADKTEPKFKVGDIIRHKKHGFTCKIIAIDTEYRLSECMGTHLPFDWQDAYELVDPNELDTDRFGKA